MNSYLERAKRFVWTGGRKYVFLAFLLLLISIFYSRSRGSSEVDASVFTVKKIDLVQEVTVTGNVKPSQNVALSFDASGRVATVAVSVGTHVGPGTLIAALSNGNLRADLEKAEAALSETKKGARPEDIAVSEADLAKARQDLLNYFATTPDTLDSALLKADAAINDQTDALFSNGNTSNPQLNFAVSEFQNRTDAEKNRINAVRALDELTTTVNTLTTDTTAQKNALLSARTNLQTINDYLSVVYNAVTNATGLSVTTQNTYKTNTGTARTNVTSAISSINSLLQSIASQEVTVQKNENALNLKKAGATPEELARAEADVTAARALLAKTIIYSPIAGVVSKADPKTGETVSAGAALFEVISDGRFEIEVNVPEVDVAKIAVGNSAKITLDAYGDDEEFLAHVSKVDPAEKIVDGVPTYKTTLSFDKADTRIRSGMTANITIETNKKENVLAIPGRAIITQGGEKMVRVLEKDGTIKEVPVTTGLRGSAGLVEIVSGLSENDRVVTQASAN